MQTLLWDPVNGIGLNLLRIGIDGTSGSPNIMGAAGYADGQACVKFNGSDCKVWAAPWSPPANMKDNNNVNNGGHLLAADYTAWAKVLAGFPAFYKSHGGVDLYADLGAERARFHGELSVGLFNASQMVSWIDTLGPMLAALSPPVKVLAAEPDNWGNIWGGDGYGPAIIADSMANIVRRSDRHARLRRHQRGHVRASGAARKQHAPRLGDGVHAGRHGADHHRHDDLRGVLDRRRERVALLVDPGARAERQQPAPAGLRARELQQVRSPRLLPRRRQRCPQAVGIRAAGRGVHEPFRRDGVHRRRERRRGAERFILRRGTGVAGVGHPVCHDHQLQVGRGDAPSRFPARASPHLSQRSR